jgi:uncharacterized protein (UPF0332 family)
MATWEEMSRDSLVAAKQLLDEGRLRSSVSRAYYAAYAAATSRLATARGIVFRHAGNNPSHEQLPELIQHYLPRRAFAEHERARLKRSIRVLWMSRVEADYAPHAQVDAGTARDAVREASVVLKRLGIEP